MNEGASESAESGEKGAKLISPSEFMRTLRPEYYSDTRDRLGYELDRAVFEHHLETITQRNQTHDFEIFCRRLCERAICPNLRPQTGPEGGGDGKVDTETYPVAEEVASLTYVGSPAAGQERWAFAFSAKAKWIEKVRSDVQGIVEERRGYSRIFCVTSRASPSKARHGLEAELTAQYGIPVLIHDRSWIVEQIIDHDRKDLAYNYLGVGKEAADPLRLGPTDYSRLQQLTDLERELEDPTAFAGMEKQRVTEALVAAKLARGLERPRIEVDGRFTRAIRLAEKHGSLRQKLAAHYEMIWTAFWWYDDIALVNAAYDEFEKKAFTSEHASGPELVVNLQQLLVNGIIHGLLRVEDSRIEERRARLIDVLTPMAADLSRPNNSLEAETSLAVAELNAATLSRDQGAMADVWRKFTAILQKAEGLGEFDPRRLILLVDAVGEIAETGPAYLDLIEGIATFVSNRTGEIEGARVLLRHAAKLDFEHNLEIIRLMGRAAIGLSKKEHRDSLVEALHLLGLAYRSAGLLWAARSAFAFAAACLVIEGEEDDQLPVLFVPTIKTFAWIALELRHIPDFLEAVQVLAGCAVSLPLDDESKKKVLDDLRQLDVAMGSVFLNMTEDELRQLAEVPDILKELGFTISRMALLYAMGREDVLRERGDVPAEQSPEALKDIMASLADQPVSAEPRYRLATNKAGPGIYAASIMGMTVDVEFDGSVIGTLVAEALLGSLEAFFATALERDVYPHTERFHVTVLRSEGAKAPAFDIELLEYRGVLTWPATLSPNDYVQQESIQRMLAAVSGEMLAATCMVDDYESFLRRLFTDEAVQQRMGMITAALNSYHRVFARPLTRFDTWTELDPEAYELKLPLPLLKHPHAARNDIRESDGEGEAEEPKAEEQSTGRRPSVRDHREIAVRSVIDVHAWNRARWRGAAFMVNGVPLLGVMFEDEIGARKIFERWRERFGGVDTAGELSLTVVRKLPGHPDHHYCMVVAASVQNVAGSHPGRLYSMPNRSQLMEPADGRNLDRFLAALKTSGEYYVVPAILANETTPPRFLDELAIRKFDFRVLTADELEAHDVANVALLKRSARGDSATMPAE